MRNTRVLLMEEDEGWVKEKAVRAQDGDTGDEWSRDKIRKF